MSGEKGRADSSQEDVDRILGADDAYRVLGVSRTASAEAK